MTLSALCRDLNNYFDYDRIVGSFEIRGGVFVQSLPLLEGQYFTIWESVFNNGVHKFGDTDLVDEKFEGVVWLMKLPADVVELCNKITEWETNNAAQLNGPFTSESFGGYSYSKMTGKKGGTPSYMDVGEFAMAVSKWRKICPY